MTLFYVAVLCLLGGALADDVFSGGDALCQAMFMNEISVASTLGANKCSFSCSNKGCSKLEVPNGEPCAPNKECLSAECIDSTPELSECKEVLGKQLKGVREAFCATECLTSTGLFGTTVGHTINTREGQDCTPTLAKLGWSYTCEKGDCMGKRKRII